MSRATPKAARSSWQLVTGTARGRSHQVRDMPSQDAIAASFLDQAQGAVLAVADGHGHERHFRSDAGSALAVDVAQAVAADHAAAVASGNAKALASVLPQVITGRWRSRVARDVKARPYTSAQRQALEEAGDGPEVPYGSTLLVAIACGGWLACAQIGDGDMVAVGPDGSWEAPVAADPCLDGHRTTSLCQPDAAAAFRVGVRDLAARPLAALLLATDGYGNAQAADPWQPEFARDMAELLTAHDPGWFAGHVQSWAQLCASGEGSGDDTTIGLLLPACEGQRGSTRPASGEKASTWTA